VSGFKLFATLLAVFTVENFGRKKLLYIGCSLMFFALMVLGVAFAYPYVSEADCNAMVSDSNCGGEPKCQWNTGCDCDSEDTSCTCCTISGLDAQKMWILFAMFVYIGGRDMLRVVACTDDGFSGYQVGFGPMSWLIISEVFPLEVRGKAVALAVVSNFFWNTGTFT
jgi:MFS family permease